MNSCSRLRAASTGAAVALMSLVGGAAVVHASTSAPTSAGRIVFASVGGSSEAPSHLYVMRADGAQVRRLPDDSCAQNEPQWSPDGQKVVFRRCGAIATLNADGSDLRQLTHPPSGGGDSSPSWSPNGAQIVFSTNRTTDPTDLNAEIYVMDADGSNQRELIGPTATPDLNDKNYAPAWSPDGRDIAFINRPSVGNNASIWLVHPDGTGLRQAVGGSVFTFAPAWSPDSKTLAFEGETQDQADGCRNQVLTVEVPPPNSTVAERSDAEQLTHAPGCNTDPAWSPDGSSLAFHSTRDNGDEIYSMTSDGSGQRRLTSDAVHGFGPSWAADPQSPPTTTTSTTTTPSSTSASQPSTTTSTTLPTATTSTTSAFASTSTTARSRTISVSSPTGPPGASIQVTADGYLPGSAARIILHSDPVTLASLTATNSGVVQATVTIPKDVPVGAHSVEVLGLASDGSPLSQSTPFTVMPATARPLPRTGASSARLVLWSVFLICVGIAAVRSAVRR